MGSNIFLIKDKLELVTVKGWHELIAQEHLDNSHWIYCLNEREGGGRSRKVVSNNALGVACRQDSAAVGNATGFTPWDNPVLTELCTNRPGWPEGRCCHGGSNLGIILIEKRFSCFLHSLGRGLLKCWHWSSLIPCGSPVQDTRDVWMWKLLDISAHDRGWCMETLQLKEKGTHNSSHSCGSCSWWN